MRKSEIARRPRKSNKANNASEIEIELTIKLIIIANPSNRVRGQHSPINSQKFSEK